MRIACFRTWHRQDLAAVAGDKAAVAGDESPAAGLESKGEGTDVADLLEARAIRRKGVLMVVW